MADDSFEDSFESSSDSETRTEIEIAYTTKEDLTNSFQDFNRPTDLSENRQWNQERAHGFSAPVDPDSFAHLGIKVSLSPRFSPKTRKKFRPHLPQGLGNITQKMKKRKKKVFGINLQTAVYRSQLGTDGLKLPTVFRECIDYLEENALDHEGIYRLAGVKSQIEGVKALYDKGAVVDLNEYDPNTITSLLKLYLRELPEPLIPLRLMPRFEAAAQMGTVEMQIAVLRLLMEEVPLCNNLLLGWLLIHMSHIAERSRINKMGISNLIIVFSPSLQISIPVMHLLYNNHKELFPDMEIVKYVRPQEQSSAFDLPDPDALETEEEVTAELTRLSDLLEKLHTKVHSSEGKYDERDDYCWELQRVVTELKRRKKLYEKMSASKLGDEQEFIKTLMIMEATLQAENEELMIRNTQLKEEIRHEAKLIEQCNSDLRLYEIRKSPVLDDVELNGNYNNTPQEDDAQMSQQITKLLWQKRELQSQYNNLVDDVEKEEKAIFQLKVKLKVLPIEQSLATTE